MNKEAWKLLLGQRLCVGFDGYTIPDEYRQLIHDMKIGNAILFRRNVKDYEQLRTLCSDLRCLMLEKTGREPFIMIDEESGTVSRLAAAAIPTPSAMAIGATSKPENAGSIGQVIGEMLSAVGVNMNLAPVLDCNTNPNNPVIGERSFGSDPELVSDCAIAYMKGLQMNGVLACGKHFPGHGDTSVDSHIGLPVVDKPIEALQTTELVPFQRSADAGIDAIMSAHVIFPALEPERKPCTVSRNVMTGLLRETMGFDGLIISDGLEMHAVMDLYGIEEATRMALDAGIDIALICHSADQARSTMQHLLNAVRQGELDQDAALKSVERIIRAKAKLQPVKENGKELFGNETQLTISKRIMAEAVKVLHAPNGRPLPELEQALFLGVPSTSRSVASDPLSMNAAHICAEALHGTWLTDIPAGMINNDRALVVFLSAHHPQHNDMVDCIGRMSAAGVPVVAVSMTTPYCLDELPDSVWKIAVYEYDQLGVEALINCMKNG